MGEAADVLVIGGGVFGLSVARSCVAAGLRVALAEARSIGSPMHGGASDGPVGALTPHRPGRWCDFKQFQLDALLALPRGMAALATETGRDPGYARTGRMTPLADAAQRARAEAQVAEAAAHWGGVARFEVLEAPPGDAAGWLAPEACRAGLIHETLSARVAPRRYLAALKASLAGRTEIREGWRCTGLDPARGTARFDRGDITAGHVVLAAGTGSFALLQEITGQRCGTGVKGQAALLAMQVSESLPVIQGDGVFIVPHGREGVAVGSTSEKSWESPGPDAHIDTLVELARTLCPALSRAPVAERWAGIRPKAPGTEPMVGPLPGIERLIVATGGYKIGFGIAHLVGDAVAAMIRGEAARHPLPANFAPERHLARGRARVVPDRPAPIVRPGDPDGEG